MLPSFRSRMKPQRNSLKSAIHIRFIPYLPFTLGKFQQPQIMVALSTKQLILLTEEILHHLLRLSRNYFVTIRAPPIQCWRVICMEVVQDFRQSQLRGVRHLHTPMLNQESEDRDILDVKRCRMSSVNRRGRCFLLEAMKEDKLLVFLSG